MNLQLFSDLSLTDLPDAVTGGADRVLGGAWLGQLDPAVAPGWPVQGIAAPLLGKSNDCLQEIWRCDAACAAGESEGILWRRAGNLLYGVIELDESDFIAGPAGSALQSAAAEAYRRIFRLLDSQGLPNLWRVWNYLAGINAEIDGLERYRQFNIGRQDAFLEYRHVVTGNVPAACAIGLASGPLSIAFMAGDLPAVPVENPRQVSAYNYPSVYGPRSPTFSRAALVYLPGQEILFISGTASIVGHQTVHPGDVVGQCRESMANIATVVAEANRLARTPPYTLGELSYRVYIRHAGDFSLVEATLSGLIGDAVEIVYVQADICRHDLLLEIEAMASHTLGSL